MHWSGTADPSKEGSDYAHERQFEWRHRGEQFTLDVDVPAYLYRYYDDRWRTREFGSYVVDPFHDDVVGTIASEIAALVGRDERDAAECVIRFGQSIPYERDVVTTGQPEYPQFPVETLYHRQGDCEDLSILVGALLRELGLDVAILVVRDRSHMCLGVAAPWASGAYVEHEGTEYYVLECTDTGWDVGEVPPEYGSSTAQTYPVDEVPLLLHQWEATDTGEGTARLDGSLVNYGTGAATDVAVRAWFEGPDDRRGALATVAREDEVLPRSSVSFSGTVPLPRAGRVRGTVQVLVDGGLHDVTKSDWR